MKKYLFLLVCVLFAQSFYSLSFADKVDSNTTEQEVPHRKAYAYFQSNYDFDGYGIGTFYLDTPEKTELIYPFGDSEGIYAGAVANGLFYACVYEYKTMGPPEAKNLTSINIETGERKEIGPWAEDFYMRVFDMTYNYANKTMYAVAQTPDIVNGFYTVDLTTGKFTYIAETPIPIHAIAASYEGEIYAMGRDGVLYKLNAETGDLTEVCKTEYNTPGHHWSMEFDHTDGNLYLVGSSQNLDNAKDYYLFRFNMKENPITCDVIGTVSSEDSETQCYGLYIPFVLGGEYAPSAITNFSVEPDKNGKLEATLKWTNPSKTFGGSDLTELTSVTIIRNNDTIATVPATEIGKQMEWTDNNVPSHGEYEYTIYASNKAGDGETTVYNQYIGPDSPSAVKNIVATASENCEYINISWNKSEEGAHGNYYNLENTTYKVIRYPDETVVAENLKDTFYTDNNIKRLARYYYEVYAVNDFGENSAISQNYIIAGPAMNIPYSDAFNDKNVTINQISVYDSNQDTYGWVISSGFGYYQFKDNTPAIEYLINPSLTPTDIDKDADEWFITPPLKFEANKQYVLTFDYRSIKNENIVITLSGNNSVESQNEHETVDIKALEDESVEFTKYTTLLPTTPNDCIQCIGFHLTTPFPEDRYSFLQITNIEVKEYVSIDETEDKNLISIKAIDGNIIIEGQFNEAEVYSADGMKVASTSENVIPAGTLEKGLYLVRVMKDNKAETFKVML